MLPERREFSKIWLIGLCFLFVEIWFLAVSHLIDERVID